MSHEPLLSFKNVSFKFGKKTLLKKINLSIEVGQSIGIVGDNGTGKSTLVKLALGLISPDNGDVSLFQKPSSWKTNYPSLGYIGDPSHSPGELGLPDSISVKEMIDCFRGLCEIPLPSNVQDCESKNDLWDLSPGDFFEQLINLLNIKKLYSRDVGRLSNGERKKIMTLLALGKQPELLIADEATEGLDKTTKPIILKGTSINQKKRTYQLSAIMGQEK